MSFDGLLEYVQKGMEAINPFGGNGTQQTNSTLRHPLTTLACLAMIPKLPEKTKIHFPPSRVAYLTPEGWRGNKQSILRSNMDKSTKSFSNLSQPVNDLIKYYDLKDPTIIKLCNYAIQGFEILDNLYAKQGDPDASFTLTTIKEKLSRALKKPESVESPRDRKYVKMQEIIDQESLQKIVELIDQLHSSHKDPIQTIERLNILRDNYDKIFEDTIIMLNTEK